jgi:hypothetical protein
LTLTGANSCWCILSANLVLFSSLELNPHKTMMATMNHPQKMVTISNGCAKMGLLSTSNLWRKNSAKKET